ncbi:MAG: hypothetical protein GC192_16680 [Bacteroidetes bacterium]|nr:hypothetical protein [Bacteroidota bacterium]
MHFIILAEGLLPTQRSGVAIGEHQTHNLQVAAAASSASQFVSLPALQHRQPQRPRSRHSAAVFTAHSSVSFWRCPCLLATRSQPNPIATHQFVPPGNLPTPDHDSPAAFLGKHADHRPGSGAVPAAVAASPPCLRRRCHCF